VAKVVGERL